MIEIINLSNLKRPEFWRLLYKDNEGVTHIISNEDNYKILIQDFSLYRNDRFNFEFQDLSKSDVDLIEEMKDQKSGFSNMTACPEKSLLTLEYIMKLKQAQIIDEEFFGFNVDREIDNLEARISCKDSSSKGFQLKFIDRDSLLKIKNAFRTEDWKSVSESIGKLVKQIRVLNIQKIIRRVKKSRSSRDLATGQPLISFYGQTGAGKSTAIQVLGGAEMAKEDSSDPVFLYKTKNKDLKKITVSASSKSETKDVICVRVNCNDVNGSERKGQIILVDFPGSNDTAGPETNIANACNTRAVNHGSESVVLVMVISYLGNGDRLEGLRKDIYFIKEMFSNLTLNALKENYLQSIQYLFTKYPKEKVPEVHNLFETLYKDMSVEERADEKFVAILNDLLEKTKPSQIMVIDPIGDEYPGKILDRIAETRPIFRPDEVLQFALDEKSREIMREQILIHKAVIIEALSKSDFDLFQYKLEELQCFEELVGDKMVEEMLKKCFKDILKHETNSYDQSRNKINLSMKEENTLTEKEIEEYKKADFKLKTLRNLGVPICDDVDLVANLESQIDNLFQSLGIKNSGENSSIIKSTYKKMKLIPKHFPEFEKKCQTIDLHLQNLFEKSC